jgi:hypothetical protein
LSNKGQGVREHIAARKTTTKWPNTLAKNWQKLEVIWNLVLSKDNELRPNPTSR